MRYNNNNNKTRVTGLVCVVESEKAFGVLPLDVILSNSNPNEITHKDHARNRFEGLMVWLPKSQISNVDMRPTNIFPNLQISYPSKFNQNMFPYKTQIDADIPEWLAIEKSLVSFNEDGAPPPQQQNQNNNQSNYNDSW